MILVRCDAGPVIGMGHLMRCRAVAHVLKKAGQSLVMIGPDEKYMVDSDSLTFEKWIPIPDWESSERDAAFVSQLAERLNASFLILDDYRVDTDYQAYLKATSVRWLQFLADFSQRVDAPFIVNSNPAATIDKYLSVSDRGNTEFLLGAKYSILRAEFSKREVVVPEQNEYVLVCFGAGDDRGAIQKVLDCVAKPLEGTECFHIVSGAANPRNSSLQEKINNDHSNVIFSIAPDNMPELYRNAKVMITSGGGTTFEAAFYSIPMVLIATDSRQVNQSKAWEDIGAGKFLGELTTVAGSTILEALSDIIRHRSIFSKNLRGVVDGFGRFRIADRVLQFINQNQPKQGGSDFED